MKGLAPHLHGVSRQVVGRDGDWMPIYRIGDFEVWVIRYACGHSQLLRLREHSRYGQQILREAWGRMQERKRFACVHCFHTGEDYVSTLIAGIGRLR